MSVQKPATPILVLLAGTNDPSNSAILAEHFSLGMRETEGVTIETIRIRDLSLEHFTLKHYDARTEQGTDYDRLKTAVERAKGVVIATPIWNFSVPAHLKNAIDRMGAFGLDAETRMKGQLGGKPFYLLFTGGSGTFVWKSVMSDSTSHMREAIKYFGGTVMGTYFEEHCMTRDRKFELVLDSRPESLTKVKALGKSFGKIVSDFAETGKLPATKVAKGLFYKVAGMVVKKLT